ncbi:MAG: hypothetical protein JSV19_13605 [Phycisphaerales bacterium]|nr:MAG: hypothetical protein JSV19_13605 [Phycisphaerales bacterium]
MSETPNVEQPSAGSAVAVPGRWWMAVAAGMIVAVPLGWLLSFAAALFVYLGLFFFMLFGLLIGAAMFRIGRTARPIAKRRIRIGTAMVVLVGWGVSMAIECHDFPSDVAERTVGKFRVCPDGMTPDDIKRQSAHWVREHLREHYPPGGAIGYVRWKLSSNRLDVQLQGVPSPVGLHFRDNKAWWLVRVILSILLFAFAVHSIVRPLAAPEHAETSASRAADTPHTESAPPGPAP